MRATAESKTKKLVRELLLQYDIQPASNAGAFTTAAGWYFMPVPWGVRGIPDFVGHYHGLFFGIEAKAPSELPTGFQLLQLEALRLSGGAVFVVDGVESLKNVQLWLAQVKTTEENEGLKMPYEEPNKAERDAVPEFVANACQCRLCGAPADRHGQMFQCQQNPGHIADTLTGIFSDCTYPKKIRV